MKLEMIYIIKPILLAWFIANFEPGQQLIDKVYKHLPKRVGFTRTYLECFKCLSFWITLIMTGDIYIAILYSIIAYIYTRLINQLKINL